MAEGLSVVLASNRGPVSFVDSGSEMTRKRGAGGLAGALDPVARGLGDRALWIAAATSDPDRRAIELGEVEAASEELGYPLLLLDVDPDVYSRYYDIASNRMLWFANHCLWDEPDVRAPEDSELSAWDEAYEVVNRRFASAIATASNPAALVLVQDYHLSTVPAYLKQHDPGRRILHFTHSSFCCPGLKVLPGKIAQRVVEGMLASDLVGFHTSDWARSFLGCCEAAGFPTDRSSGSVEGPWGRSWIRTYPITIEAEDLRLRAETGPVGRWADRFADSAERLIVRADRIEPSKNIVRGFEAFGMLLDRRPDLRDTRFVACLYPSRQSLPEYRDHAARIEQAVAKVNGRHPKAIDLYMKDDFDRTLGALLVYDVLLVNSLMDGMNLVSKEGPTLNRRDGVVVLSKLAGSFEQLGRYTVALDDPRDIAATAAALERAIETSATDRRRLAEGLRAEIASHDPADWIAAQLRDLQAIRDGREPLRAPPA